MPYYFQFLVHNYLFIWFYKEQLRRLYDAVDMRICN
jgi:hypothetical protein